MKHIPFINPIANKGDAVVTPIHSGKPTGSFDVAIKCTEVYVNTRGPGIRSHKLADGARTYSDMGEALATAGCVPLLRAALYDAYNYKSYFVDTVFKNARELKPKVLVAAVHDLLNATQTMVHRVARANNITTDANLDALLVSEFVSHELTKMLAPMQVLIPFKGLVLPFYSDVTYPDRAQLRDAILSQTLSDIFDVWGGRKVFSNVSAIKPGAFFDLVAPHFLDLARSLDDYINKQEDFDIVMDGFNYYLTAHHRDNVPEIIVKNEVYASMAHNLSLVNAALSAEPTRSFSGHDFLLPERIKRVATMLSTMKGFKAVMISTVLEQYSYETAENMSGLTTRAVVVTKNFPLAARVQVVDFIAQSTKQPSYTLSTRDTLDGDMRDIVSAISSETFKPTSVLANVTSLITNFIHPGSNHDMNIGVLLGGVDPFELTMLAMKYSNATYLVPIEHDADNALDALRGEIGHEFASINMPTFGGSGAKRFAFVFAIEHKHKPINIGRNPLALTYSTTSPLEVLLVSGDSSFVGAGSVLHQDQIIPKKDFEFFFAKRPEATIDMKILNKVSSISLKYLDTVLTVNDISVLALLGRAIERVDPITGESLSKATKAFIVIDAVNRRCFKSSLSLAFLLWEKMKRFGNEEGESTSTGQATLPGAALDADVSLQDHANERFFNEMLAALSQARPGDLEFVKQQIAYWVHDMLAAVYFAPKCTSMTAALGMKFVTSIVGNSAISENASGFKASQAICTALKVRVALLLLERLGYIDDADVTIINEIFDETKLYQRLLGTPYATTLEQLLK